MQTIQTLAHSSPLKLIRQQIDVPHILQDAIAIQQIPAPTFDEAQRAGYIRDRFVSYPLEDIAIDPLYNVYGRWPGVHHDRPALLVSAHLDTVFPVETNLSIQQTSHQVYGPGLGDNSLGVAGLLALLDLFQQADLHPETDIWFVANSREEGLGDLGGIRAVWEKLGSTLGAAVVLEGMALGRIYHAGIAVRRLHITCRAPGGHSWIHFGQPSAIHGLVQLGARILALVPPTQPRTTYNIGLIEGGQSVNSLANSASLYLDLRSENTQTLAELEQQVHEAIDMLQRPDLTFETELVGNRPAGQIGTDHPLVQLATEALQAIGHPPVYEKGSTDANMLLANGLPTVTVGISYGRHAHRLDEHIDIDPIADGVWHVLLLVLAAAGQIPW